MGNGGEQKQRRSGEAQPMRLDETMTVAAAPPTLEDCGRPPPELKSGNARCPTKSIARDFDPCHEDSTSSQSAGDRSSDAYYKSSASPGAQLKSPLRDHCDKDENPLTSSSALPTALELGLDPAVLKFLTSEADIDEDSIVSELINDDWNESTESTRKDQELGSSDAQTESSSSTPTIDIDVSEEGKQYRYGSALSDDVRDFAERVRSTNLPRDVQNYMILLRAVPVLRRYNGMPESEQGDEGK